MTDIPNWLQVGLETLSLVIAVAAWKVASKSEKAASKSAKAATQSAQSAEGMLRIEKERRHDELHPDNNGLTIDTKIDKNGDLTTIISASKIGYTIFLKALPGECESIDRYSLKAGEKKSFVVQTRYRDQLLQANRIELSFWPSDIVCPCSIDPSVAHWSLIKDVKVPPKLIFI
jgi:hypothetical protein